ncbi:MAG TPA: PEGA domain-containing protein, partial [Thermotogota bacterium]|nr:PEGA domain-containing protein [Thermotogota bacterium]
QEQHLHVTLPKRTQRVQIQSNVENATIYIDGEEKGPTPQNQDFAWGSTHEIQAKAEGYHDARTTWQWGTKDLERGDRIQLQLEKRPVTLMIQSEPQEASIHVNGEEQRNASGPLEVEWGTELHVTASAPGYETLEQTLTPEKSPEKQTQTLRLQKRTTAIHIDSEPTGADVWTEGKRIGSTPLDTQVEWGKDIEIQLKKSGYTDQKIRIHILQNQVGTAQTHEATLQKAPGKVTITTSPSGASIYINGTYKGTSGYTYEGQEGSIQVEVRKSGYHSKGKTIQIEAGETKTERISLEQVTGKVTITTSPSGASIYINGSYKTTSSYTYEGPEGTIQVEVKKEGYESKSQTVEV